MKRSILTLKVIIYSAFISLMCSCQNDLVTEGIINIEDEYDLYITQSLDEKGSSVAMKVKSIKDQHCSNAFLSYSSNTNSETLELFLNRFHLEGPCEEGSNHAEEVIPLNLQHDSKPITINIAGAIRNQGDINIDNENFELDMQSNNGFKISQAKINRIKTNLKWGTFYSTQSETANLINSYFQSINNGIPVKKGNYGLFNLDQNGHITTNVNTEHISFAFYSNENFDDLKNYITEISAADNSLVLQLTNYDGRSLNIQ